jgi:hypothetical protein
LSAPPGCAEVKLTGSHYYGLGARFITSMDKIGTFINSANATGDVVRGTERLTNAKWCAYTAPVDDKPVTFAMFDHPQNLRHPNKMFTMLMPFSYLSVTYNLWKEPYELKAGSPLDLRYGVAVWDGKVAANQVEATYRAWVKLAGR